VGNIDGGVVDSSCLQVLSFLDSEVVEALAM